MFLILALLATFTTAPIDGGLDYAYQTWSEGTVHWLHPRIVSVEVVLLDEDLEEIDSALFMSTGGSYHFYLGNYDDDVNIEEWTIEVWVTYDGYASLFPAVTHFFEFPDDFDFVYPGKAWVHTQNFAF